MPLIRSPPPRGGGGGHKGTHNQGAHGHETKDRRRQDGRRHAVVEGGLELAVEKGGGLGARVEGQEGLQLASRRKGELVNRRSGKPARNRRPHWRNRDRRPGAPGGTRRGACHLRTEGNRADTWGLSGQWGGRQQWHSCGSQDRCWRSGSCSFKVLLGPALTLDGHLVLGLVNREDLRHGPGNIGSRSGGEAGVKGGANHMCFAVVAPRT